MQVSWIDPDEIARLVGQIDGPLKPQGSTAYAWEVHTLPVTAVPAPAAESLLEPSKPKPAPPPPELPLSDGTRGPRNGELWRIRENLRSLREQAQESGLLPPRSESSVSAEGKNEVDVAPDVQIEQSVPTDQPNNQEQATQESVTAADALEPFEIPPAPPRADLHTMLAQMTPPWQTTPLQSAAVLASELAEALQGSVASSSEALPEAPMDPFAGDEEAPPPMKVKEPVARPMTGNILPTPAPKLDPAELPAPTPPKPPTAPLTIEFSGPPITSPDYEPLFGATVSTLPPIQPPPPPTEPMAEAAPLPAMVNPTTAVVITEPTSPPALPPPPLPAPEPMAPEVVIAPFTPPAAGLSDRLAALGRWAGEVLACKELLLVDDYGDVLWGTHSQSPLVLSALMACQAAQRASPDVTFTEPQRMDKELSNGRWLSVVPARTRYGSVSLAAMLSQPMSPLHETAVREALVKAVELA